MRDLIGLNRYMIRDEGILTIGFSGISGQVELGSMVIKVNLKSHEDLKSTLNFFIYVSELQVI